jgi:hypothetical protein
MFINIKRDAFTHAQSLLERSSLYFVCEKKGSTLVVWMLRE